MPKRHRYAGTPYNAGFLIDRRRGRRAPVGRKSIRVQMTTAVTSFAIAASPGDEHTPMPTTEALTSGWRTLIIVYRYDGL